jgi:hypothetical protein
MKFDSGFIYHAALPTLNLDRTAGSLPQIAFEMLLEHLQQAKFS